MTNKQNPQKACSLVVLISGNGSNLQAIIDATTQNEIPARIVAVISNRADAYGLERAQQAGITTAVLDNKDHPSREDYDLALLQLIDSYEADLVVLAGFMRILTADLVQHYHGRMLNIHPSLLPKYRGLHTHRKVLESGDTEHGASVHFVTAELDSGPVVLQAIIAVQSADTESTLAARVLKQEHRIYPIVIGWFAQNRLKYDHNGVTLDDKPLTTPCWYNINSETVQC